MLLHIKNMVCNRCITVVKQQLEHLDLQVSEVSLGTAIVSSEPNESKLAEIASALTVLGFELIDKDKDKLIEGIRNVIIGLIHHSELTELHVNFSQALTERLHKNMGI